jgi:DNA-binding CsgD family transcriptional regulator
MALGHAKNQDEADKGSDRANLRAQRQLEALTEKIMPVRRLGWAFLLAWVFCVFYTKASGPLSEGPAGDSTPIASVIFYAAFPLFCSVATLIAVIATERFHSLSGPGSSARTWAPAICALGTPLLYVSIASPVANALVFGTGSMLTGVGSGILWVMWGAYYATLDRDDVETLSPVSGFLALALTLVVAHVSGWLSIALVCLFPLVCGAMLSLSLHDVEGEGGSRDGSEKESRVIGDYDRTAVKDAHEHAALSPARSLHMMGACVVGIFASCAIVCILGMGQENGLADSSVQFDLSLAFSAVVTGIVYVGATRHARHVTARYLFRWMLPMLLAGLAFPVWMPGQLGNWFASSISIAARFGFCTFTQMYFALVASRGNVTPTQSYGMGWAAVHAGDLAGVIIGVAISPALSRGTLGWASAAMAMAVALACIIMAVIERADFALLGSAQSVEEMPATVDPCGYRSFTEQTAQRQEDAPASPQAGETSDGSSAERSREARLEELAEANGLTARETQVLRLLSQGRSVPFIRDELVISRDTAATHVKHIYAKLGVHSRQELLDLFE